MLRIEAWVVVGAVYIAIVFAYLWPSDFRNAAPAFVGAAWAAFMIRTFLFHFGIVLLPVALVTLWRRSWRLLAAAVPLLAVTLGPAVWELRPRARPALAGEAVTVMSVNLLVNNRMTAPLIAEIQAARPDVLLLQEYSAHWHEALQAALATEYAHVAFVSQEDSFGAAIYARRPFVGPVDSRVPLGSLGTPQMRAVIRIGGRDVAFYNVHLLPQGGLDTTIEHRTQFADLLDVLAKEPLPVVMAGDFNFTETSLQASALSGLGLAEAQVLGGRGRGATWPVNSFLRWVPGLRLDHIYVGGGVTCAQCRTGVGQGSDHRPVVVKLGFE
jgi:endonuclease/exonuclease/phosphatase (EEP) superfamily protein YafD